MVKTGRDHAGVNGACELRGASQQCTDEALPSPGFGELKFGSADLSLDKERC